MPSMSYYLEQQLLQQIFRSATFSKPQGLCIGLGTGTVVTNDQGWTMTNKEVGNSGAYARVPLSPLDANWAAVTQTASNSGTTANSFAITFPQATANWGTITNVMIFDSGVLGTGNMLFFGQLTTPKTVQVNDTFSFAVNQLSVYFD